MDQDIRIVTETELRHAVGLDLEAVRAIDGAFRALAGDGAATPPPLALGVPDSDGDVAVETAALPGYTRFVLKLRADFAANLAANLPRASGLVMLCSAETGRLETLFLDNAYLTDLRTAATGAVAARHLAPDRVETLGILGTGVQARLQAEAAMLVRPYARVLVWGRDMENAAGIAAGVAGTLNIEGAPEPDPARLVAESQMVVTATPAQEPILKADWLHPGLHVTALGADAAGKNEVAPQALADADRYVVDRLERCAAAGELRAARAAGFWVEADPAELGQVAAGAAAGRQAPREVTICDLAGSCAPDTALAIHAADRVGAGAAGGGTLVPC